LSERSHFSDHPSRTKFAPCKENPVFREVNGLWGLIVLVADIWAIVNIFQSNASTGRKVLWTVLVILLPVLGFIIWFFFGPKTSK
jgi:Phospholipase_D-nuclease N-terminal